MLKYSSNQGVEIGKKSRHRNWKKTRVRNRKNQG
jgi:hypothetical protein